MNTTAIDKKGCRLVAHRGVSGLEKENTCAAFVAAGVKSYFGIETDVHVTADGKYIVVHDDDLRRVAGVDLQVEKTDFDTLIRVPLPDTDGTPRSDLRLPSLNDYISICRKYEKTAVLELKNRMPRGHVAGIAAVVKDMGWLDRTIFISFSGENLVDLRELYPEAEIEFLTCEASEENFRFMEKYRFGADLCGSCVTPGYVARLHAAGLKVILRHARIRRPAARRGAESQLLDHRPPGGRGKADWGGGGLYNHQHPRITCLKCHSSRGTLSGLRFGLVTYLFVRSLRRIRALRVRRAPDASNFGVSGFEKTQA